MMRPAMLAPWTVIAETDHIAKSIGNTSDQGRCWSLELVYDVFMTVIETQIDAYEGEVADAAGVLNLANSRLVEITARLLADDAWEGTGVHSPTQWLAYPAGVSTERARAIVHVAQRALQPAPT